APIADLITAYSNGVATQSFAKFRHAIGQLALAEPKHTADTAITTYFTWKELGHASYFDLAALRKLIFQALSRADPFAPSERFLRDRDFARTAQWLADVEDTPAATRPGDGRDPRPSEATTAGQA